MCRAEINWPQGWVSFGLGEQAFAFLLIRFLTKISVPVAQCTKNPSHRHYWMRTVHDMPLIGREHVPAQGCNLGMAPCRHGLHARDCDQKLVGLGLDRLVLLWK